MHIISRSEAKSQGASHYYTGKPCKQGHVCIRRTDNGDCVKCRHERIRHWRVNNAERERERQRRWREANLETVLARQRLWQEANRKARRDYMRRYRAENLEKCRERTRRWRTENREAVLERRRQNYAENPEFYREIKRRWDQSNPEKVLAYNAKRRAEKLRATPKWADLETIKLFYECCPKGCEVDHIVPLRGDTVCGLHVENNLQWLPAKLNRAKSNNWSMHESQPADLSVEIQQ